jgi:hypothetical protein
MKINKIKKRPYRGVVVADSWLEHFVRNGGDPTVLFSVKSRHLKSSDSGRSAIVEIGLAGQNDKIKEIYAKEFFYKNFFHSCKPLLWMHRAQILWRNSMYLLQKGVSVPKPAGYLLKQNGFSCRGAYFFSEALTGCIDLGTLAYERTELNRRLDAGRLIETVATMIASLHNICVIHGDLKWSNIMVHEQKNEVWFIDLDSLKRRIFNPGMNFYLQDVARFVVNGQEVGINESIVDRFLETYAQRRKLTRKSIDGPVARRARMLKIKRQKKYAKRSKTKAG